MWVARNKDGHLGLFFNDYPERGFSKWSYNTGHPYYQTIYYDELLNKNMFPKLKWEDEPLEVELVVKGKVEELIDYICKQDREIRELKNEIQKLS